MKNQFLKIIFCLIIILLSNFAKSQESYVVQGKRVNLREDKNENSKIIGTIPGGEIVSVLNMDNSNWWFVSYFGNEGYISSKLLVKLDKSDKYRNWEKKSANTGDNPECDNFNPTYDFSIDNELIIHVGNNSDVIVKLMNYTGNCIRIAYIKGGDSYKIKNIPEGYYYLKIAYGKDFRKYNQKGKCIVKFMVDATYEKSSDKLDFYKIRKANTIEGDYEYKNWVVPSYELSLNLKFTKGSLENFHSNKISESEFVK